ncbi:hypothetical protein RFI_26440, partial [Reticulomyxa filosa]
GTTVEVFESMIGIAQRNPLAAGVFALLGGILGFFIGLIFGSMGSKPEEGGKRKQWCRCKAKFLKEKAKKLLQFFLHSFIISVVLTKKQEENLMQKDIFESISITMNAQSIFVNSISKEKN